MAFDAGFGYADLVENRLAGGRFFDGPCSAWFRLNHPLVKGEEPSPYQRVAVAANSGNGISAALDFKLYLFVNSDLTINLFRRPTGKWICLQSASWFGGNGCGLAESALYDEAGLIGRASQGLTVRRRRGSSDFRESCTTFEVAIRLIRPVRPADNNSRAVSLGVIFYRVRPWVSVFHSPAA